MIRKPRPERIQMTDHAFVRYLERYLGVDIQDVKSHLISQFPNDVPDGRYTVDGVTFLIRNNHIITVLEENMRSKSMYTS